MYSLKLLGLILLNLIFFFFLFTATANSRNKSTPPVLRPNTTLPLNWDWPQGTKLSAVNVTPHAPTPPMRWWALWETPTFKSFLYPINPTLVHPTYPILTLLLTNPTNLNLIPTSLLSIWYPILVYRILSHLNAFLKSRVLKSIYKHKVPTIIYKKWALI